VVYDSRKNKETIESFKKKKKKLPKKQHNKISIV